MYTSMCFRRNLYYLKDSAVMRNLTASEHFEGDSIRLWHMRLKHTSLDSLHAQVKQGVLKGAQTFNLKFGERCVLDKNKVKFGTAIHRMGGLLDCVQVTIRGPIKTSSLGGHRHFVSFVDDSSSRRYQVYPMRQKFEALDLLVK